jgi:hypothetical protein
VPDAEIELICAQNVTKNAFADDKIFAGCTAKESRSAVEGVAVPAPTPGNPGAVVVATTKLFGASVMVGATVGVLGA